MKAKRVVAVTLAATLAMSTMARAGGKVEEAEWLLVRIKELAEKTSLGSSLINRIEASELFQGLSHSEAGRDLIGAFAAQERGVDLFTILTKEASKLNERGANNIAGFQLDSALYSDESLALPASFLHSQDAIELLHDKPMESKLLTDAELQVFSSNIARDSPQNKFVNVLKSSTDLPATATDAELPHLKDLMSAIPQRPDKTIDVGKHSIFFSDDLSKKFVKSEVTSIPEVTDLEYYHSDLLASLNHDEAAEDITSIESKGPSPHTELPVKTESESPFAFSFINGKLELGKVSRLGPLQIKGGDTNLYYWLGGALAVAYCHTQDCRKTLVKTIANKLLSTQEISDLFNTASEADRVSDPNPLSKPD